jgi:hypothetical protein
MIRVKLREVKKSGFQAGDGKRQKKWALALK